MQRMSEELEGDENMGFEMAVEVERTQIREVQAEKRKHSCWLL